jgi:alpha-beta hydrolase superfamily lysophospholipase
VPTLALYGAKDEVIPAEPVNRVFGKLPNAVQAHYTDGYHMLLRDLNGKQVILDIAAWIDRPDAALPSGADLFKSLDRQHDQ